MNEMKMYTAIVPVKANSSRLPGKNFLPINGKNSLLENKISQLKNISQIKKIIVSSDSEKAENIAKELGVHFVRRPIEYANETRPLSDFFRYVSGIFDTEHMIWACVTSPLIDQEDFIRAIELYESNVIHGQHDSLITVYNFQHYLMNENGPLNYQRGEGHKNSDQLDILHLFTNGILICSKENLVKWGYNYGDNPYRMVVNQEKSIDIDTKWDYLIAKAWIEERKK